MESASGEWSTHLEDDVAEVLLVAIQGLQQLQLLAVQLEDGLTLGEDQVESNLRIRIAEDRQLWRRGRLSDDCGKRINNKVRAGIEMDQAGLLVQVSPNRQTDRRENAQAEKTADSSLSLCIWGQVAAITCEVSQCVHIYVHMWAHVVGAS